MRHVTAGLFCALTLALAPAAASAASFGGGLRLGPTFSRFGGDDAGRSDIRTGFELHLITEIAANPIFAIQPELGFVERGETRKLDFFGAGDEVSTRLRYLEIPVMLRVHIPIPVVTPYVEAGPYLAFLLDADMLSSGGDREVNSAFKSVDYGVALGAGVLIDVKVVSIMVGARYSHGLASVVDQPGVFDIDGGDPQVFNRSFAVHAGVGF